MRTHSIQIGLLSGALLVLIYASINIGGVLEGDLVGTGTKSDPFRIASCEQLQAIRENVSAHYVLVSDIDCSETKDWNKNQCPRFGTEQVCNAENTGCTWVEDGQCKGEVFTGCAAGEMDCMEWCSGRSWISISDCEDLYGFKPIGTPQEPFTGVLDGAGFRVRNLTIHRPGEDFIGLIGYARGGLVKDIHLEDTFVSSARYYVGALMGMNIAGWIENSSSRRAQVLGRHAVGCLAGTIVGQRGNGGIIRSIALDCNLEGGAVVGSLLGETVSGELHEVAGSGGTVRGSYGVGGLLGESRGSESFELFANVQTEGESRTAGIVGMLERESLLQNAISLGSVNCTECTNSDGGRLLGVLDSTSTLEGGFYLQAGSGEVSDTEGAALSTGALVTKETYTEWDFENVWFQENTGSPFLRAFAQLREDGDKRGAAPQKPEEETGYILSGTVYQEGGVVPLKEKVTVAMSVNGEVVSARVNTDKKGTFSIKDVALGSGDLLTLFLERAQTGAITIVRVTGSGAPITDLHLGRVIVHSSSIATPFGSDDIAKTLNNGGFTHPDLVAHVQIEEEDMTVQPSLELFVPMRSSLMIEGNLIAGDFVLGGRIHQGDGDVTIEGDFVLAGGRYKAGSGTSTFNRNVIIEQGYFEGSDGDVIFNYDLVGVFSFVDGKFKAPKKLFVRSDWVQTGGEFDHNKSSVIFDGTSHRLDVDEKITFYRVKVDKQHLTGLDIAIDDTVTVKSTLELLDGDISGGTVVAKGNVIHSGEFDGGTATLVVGGENKKLYLSTEGKIPRMRLDAKDTVVRVRRAQGDDAKGRNPITFDKTFRIDEGKVILSEGEEWFFSKLEMRGGEIEINGGSFLVNETFQMLGGRIRGNDGSLTFHAPLVQSGGTITLKGADLTAHDGVLLKSGTFNGGHGLVDIGGDFEMRGGRFSAPSGLMTLSGNVKKKKGKFLHNGGTVIFDGRSKNLDMNKVAFMNVEVQKAGSSHLVLAKNSTVVVNGDLTFSGGTATKGTFAVRGNVTMEPGYATGSTALQFTGPQRQEWVMEYPERFQGKVSVNKSVDTVLVLESDLSLKEKGQSLFVANGTLDLNGNSILFNETKPPSVIFDRGTKLKLQGGEELPVIDFREESTMHYSLNRGLQRLPDFTYFNLILDAPASSKFQLPEGGLTVGGDLILGGGRLHADKNQEIRLTGSWRRKGGNFFPGNGSVIFNGDEHFIEGDNMFYNLTKRITGKRKAVLVVEAGTEQRVNNQLLLSGKDCTLLKLRSSKRGEQWQLEVVGSAKIKSVDMEDLNYLTRLPFYCAQECIDRGNNENVEFQSEVCEKTVSYCSNSDVQKPTEKCDDGNLSSGDGCSALCEVEDGHKCKRAPSVCTTTCGDHIILGTEECDDGDKESGDGCSKACVVEKGFACSGTPSVCESICGDKIITGGEQCDDGNMRSGDGCSPLCQTEQGYICLTEKPRTCSLACGNRILDDDEDCDDGNTVSHDGCSAFCTLEDGFKCVSEPSKCKAECGDGFIRGGEVCDDGDTKSKDGCSESCVPEKGYICGGEPSECERVKFSAPVEEKKKKVNEKSDSQPLPEIPKLHLVFPDGTSQPESKEAQSTCGNGKLDAGEECDDRNTKDGDGCSSVCKVERRG